MGNKRNHTGGEVQVLTNIVGSKENNYNQRMMEILGNQFWFELAQGLS